MLAEQKLTGKDRPEHDSFEHLCWVAFPDGPSRQMMAMLTAYLDESYNQPTDKEPNPPLVFTVGCWLSTVEKWSRFGKQWKAELRNAGIEHFHMNKFENRIGEYEDWSDFKRHTFLRRLKRIIKDNTVYGVSVAVNCKDYDEVAKGEMRQQWGKSYYGFDVRVIIWYLGEWAKDHNYHGNIHYVFAHRDKQGGELDQIFSECLNNESARKRFRLSTGWTKAFAKDEVRLQAADLITYELNKRCVNEIGGGHRYVRASLNMFQLDRSRYAPLYMGRKQILRLYEAYRKLETERK
jgi:hypothetical protein